MEYDFKVDILPSVWRSNAANETVEFYLSANSCLYCKNDNESKNIRIEDNVVDAIQSYLIKLDNLDNVLFMDGDEIIITTEEKEYRVASFEQENNVALKVIGAVVDYCRRMSKW